MKQLSRDKGKSEDAGSGWASETSEGPYLVCSAGGRPVLWGGSPGGRKLPRSSRCMCLEASRIPPPPPYAYSHRIESVHIQNSQEREILINQVQKPRRHTAETLQGMRPFQFRIGTLGILNCLICYINALGGEPPRLMVLVIGLSLSLLLRLSSLH